MKKEALNWTEPFAKGQLHVVAVAAGGMTTCDSALSIFGIKQEEAWGITRKLNEIGETGTFLPDIPLTVVPYPKTENDVEAFLKKAFEGVLSTHKKFCQRLPIYLDLKGFSVKYPTTLGEKIAYEILSNAGIDVTFNGW